MKLFLTILLTIIPLLLSRADMPSQRIVWRAGSSERVFYADSIKYLPRDRVNIYQDGKIYNVGIESIQQ